MKIGILNVGDPTHFHVQSDTRSSIDLSLCNYDVYFDFSWRVVNDRHTSKVDKAVGYLVTDESYVDAVAEEFPQYILH